MGSWVTYGLGTENQNLPAFVVFSDSRGGPIGGAPNWGNGFMPAAYQGTPFRSTGDPIVDLKPPKEMTPERQRRWLDLLAQAQRGAPAARTRKITNSPRGFSPTSSPSRCRRTPPMRSISTRKQRDDARSTALDEEPTDHVGRQCLMARRLVERGVRFVQIFSGGGNFGESWDAHWDLEDNHGMHCAETDKPIAGSADRPEKPRPARFHTRSSGTASSAACRSHRR